MIDLKIKSVLLRNWAKFGEAHIQFPEFGLVMVTGQNTASGGKLQSVGSGKTSFGEAISRTVFGTGATALKEYSTNEQGDTYVKVTASYLGKDLVVETGYKCPELSPTGEALRYTYDGEKVERGLIAQTRTDLNKLLGITATLAEWTIFVDGDNLKFNKLSQSESVELIMAALKQPPWSAYHDRAKDALSKFKKTVAKEEGSIDAKHSTVHNAKQAVDEAQTELEAAREQFKREKAEAAKIVADFQRRIDEKRESVRVSEARLKAIDIEGKKLEDEKAAAHHALEIEYNKARDFVRACAGQRRPLLEAHHAAKAITTKAKEAHNLLVKVPVKCPTCGKPWDEKVDPKELATRKSTLDAAIAVENKAHSAYTENETRHAGAEALVESAEDKMNALGVKFDATRLTTEFQSIQRLIPRYTQEIHRLELDAQAYRNPSDSIVKTAEATLKERQSVLAKARQELDEAGRSLVEARAALKVIDYWTRAFSPTGIPNMVLRDSIGPLNREARRVSAAMTGNTIEVRYATRRALASGDEKAELLVEVDNKLGSSKLKRNSKGEGGLTNFIIAETLSSVGQVSKRIGFRWYDEVVPHQDPVVCRSIYAYMHEVAHKLGILIFMVDHNPVAANYADYFLQIEKKGTAEECAAVARWV